MKTLVKNINISLEDEANPNEEEMDPSVNNVDRVSEDLELNACVDQFNDNDDEEISALISRLLPNETNWSFVDFTNESNIVQYMTNHKSFSFMFVNGVNCAAHTIQLAIRMPYLQCLPILMTR